LVWLDFKKGQYLLFKAEHVCENEVLAFDKHTALAYVFDIWVEYSKVFVFELEFSTWV
jgi:hypothetical protein